MARFGTALSCIDGRIQVPVNQFLVDRFEVDHLDTVTRAGIVKHLTSTYDSATNSIITDLEASLNKHQSANLALVAHHDCAGNPVEPDVQRAQLRDGVDYFQRRFPDLEVIGVWVGDDWTAEIVA